MKQIKIYAGIHEGKHGWFYEVWIAARLVVFGWALTREAAKTQATLT